MNREHRDSRKVFGVAFYIFILPLNMAVGSAGVLSTLLALSLGASVAEVGVLSAANATATVVFSTLWGKLSDSSGTRKKYLAVFSLGLSSAFFALSLVKSVSLLILVYSILAIFTSGISPVALMLVVERCRGKNWEREVARYISVSNLGNICGLTANMVAVLFFDVNWLFCVSSMLCIVALFLLWRFTEEPEITLERHPFTIRSIRSVEKMFSHFIFHFLDPRHLRLRALRMTKLKPLQLLFLACFVHWIGITSFSVGEIPLMKRLGMSDSMILALNAIAGIVSVLAFGKIIPSLRQDRGKLIHTATILRGSFVLGWALSSLFLLYPVPYSFLLPFMLGVIWPINYAMIWLPILSYTISHSPANEKSVTQGKLVSITAIANVIGSIFGGAVMAMLGFTVGFVLASIIIFLSMLIFSRIDFA
ncbi:MAG: MFS transporter [Candidatus Bathyarchaeia archaeon]